MGDIDEVIKHKSLQCEGRVWARNTNLGASEYL
jgi:hypothetical protein